MRDRAMQAWWTQQAMLWTVGGCGTVLAIAVAFIAWRRRRRSKAAELSSEADAQVCPRRSLRPACVCVIWHSMHTEAA